MPQTVPTVDNEEEGRRTVPKFSAEVSLGDVLTIVGLLLASTGVFLTFLQMRIGNRQKRAEFLVSLYSQYATDSDMVAMYYEIEYDEFQYKQEDFHQSGSERQLDRILGVFRSIAKVWQMGNVTLEDLEIVAYEYLVLCRNKAVQDYLAFLDQLCERRHIKAHPYTAFRQLGKQLEDRYGG